MSRTKNVFNLGILDELAIDIKIGYVICRLCGCLVWYKSLLSIFNECLFSLSLVVSYTS